MLIGAAPTMTSDALPVWGVDCDDDLVCRAVTDETHDVRTFHLTAERPARFRFEAGQFLTFELPLPGGPAYRCYTISSPPTRPETVSITTKRVPGGPVSNWMHDSVRPGTILRATAAAGEFVLPGGATDKLLLLSGGVGVTPLMSMLRTLFDRAEDRDVTFVQSARTPADILFRDELALIAKRLPRLRITHIVEQRRTEPGWPGLTGRLDGRMLGLLVPDLAARAVYCCGPGLYMGAVREMLDAAGFDRARYNEESFAFAELPEEVAAEVLAAETEAAGHSVTFAKSGRTVACPPGMTVLDAARQAGLRLPYACTKGVCGTCKTRMISGRVDMRHGGGIRQREIDQGMVLICCSRPLEDLVFDR